MSLLLPALQKFYNALRNIKQFSSENSFYDNIGCIDNFLSEYRSVTLTLQTSLGGNNNPLYLKNLNEILLKDENVSKWLNAQRVEVVHKHPFKLKKILRLVIYDAADSAVLRKYEQTTEHEEPIGDYFEDIRKTFSSIHVADIYFSAQYLFANADDEKEVNIFNFIDKGILAMWHFLHAMKVDINDDNDETKMLMEKIDSIVSKLPHKRMLDELDYCYYKSSDCFERAEGYTLILPENRFPVDFLMNQVKQMSLPTNDFYDAFIYLHAFIYMVQKHHILSTIYVEYDDATFQSFVFSSSIRTTTYRYINKVADLILNENVENVFFVTETVGYGGFDIQKVDEFLQLGYEERRRFRKDTFLSFYKVSSQGKVFPVMINAEELVDDLSFSVAIGKLKTTNQPEQMCIMMTPIVEAYKKKMESRTQND